MSISELLESESDSAVDLGELLPLPAAMSVRQSEVLQRQKIVGSWLAQNGLDAILLTDPDTIAWFTAGARPHPSTSYDWGNPTLFVAREHRCVVCSTDQSQRLFQDEIDGLGFQVKEVPWTRPVREMLQELCEGRNVACDVPFEPAANHGRAMTLLRLQLTDYDCVHLRQLAQQTSHAVEATCRGLQPGDTEWEIQGHLAHRLYRHDIELVSAHLHSDERTGSKVCPRPSGRPVHSVCTILVTARSRGLYVTTSRTVTFGPAAESLRERYRVAAIASGTMLRYSVAGERACDTVQRGIKVYRKYGHEFAWRESALGGHAGFVHRTFPMTPTSKGQFKPNTAIAWFPQVQGVVCADTVLVKRGEPEVLSYFQDWPVIGVTLRGRTIDRADILVR